MSALARVRARVTVWRVIAAADAPALKTNAQMQPATAGGKAVGAALDRVGQLRNADVVEVGACGHRDDLLLEVFQLA